MDDFDLAGIIDPNERAKMAFQVLPQGLIRVFKHCGHFDNSQKP